MSKLICAGCMAEEDLFNPNSHYDLDFCEACLPGRRAATPRKNGKLLYEPKLTDEVLSDLGRFFAHLSSRLSEGAEDCDWITNSFDFVYDSLSWRGIGTLQFEEDWQLQRRLEKRQATLEKFIELGLKDGPQDQGAIGKILEDQRALIKVVVDEIERRKPFLRLIVPAEGGE